MYQNLKIFRGLFNFLWEELFNFLWEAYPRKVEPTDKRYKLHKLKIYSYKKEKYENKFSLELIDENLLKYCMIGFGDSLKVGDFIVINEMNEIKSTRYKIEDIDYYLEPSDMWIALFQKCKH